MSTIVLTTLNARYSHAALGLRYLYANLGALQSQASIHEFVVASKTEEIAEQLLAQQPRIVGLGIYIWNVEASTKLVALLKKIAPQIIIVLGGPEVSHESAEQRIVQLADYVITGWGDLSFAKLCAQLLSHKKPLMKLLVGEQPPLSEVQMPYAYYTDEDIAHRNLYVEASRGCPFKCEFCLSALDKTAWPFEQAVFLNQLESLYARGARRFKFVDRTFNLNVKTSLAIVQWILDKNQSIHQNKALNENTSQNETMPKNDARAPFFGMMANLQENEPTCESVNTKRDASTAPIQAHFELVPDHLPDALKAALTQFAPGTLQLEIGIQTFNPSVQKNISRKQNNAQSCENIAWLRAHTHAHLHVDLIAGLPGEDLASFARGFDQLLALNPHEIQVGILKRLRGTPIIRHTQDFALLFNPEPPYAILSTNCMDFATLQRVSRFARYWDIVANSGRYAERLKSILHAPRRLIDNVTSETAHKEAGEGTSAFSHFMHFADWLYAQTRVTHGLAQDRLQKLLTQYEANFCTPSPPTAQASCQMQNGANQPSLPKTARAAKATAWKRQSAHSKVPSNIE